MTYPTPHLPYVVKVLAWLTALLAFCFVMALISSTGALGAGLNGIELRSTPSVALLKSKLGVSVEPSARSPASGLPSAPGVFSGFATIEGISMRIVVQLDESGRVEAISATFNPAAFYDDVLAAMIRNYGTPTSRGALPMSTLGGFVVENVESDWRLPDHSTVSVLKYLLDVNKGQLQIYTDEHADAQRAARSDGSHL